MYFVLVCSDSYTYLLFFIIVNLFLDIILKLFSNTTTTNTTTTTTSFHYGQYHYYLFIFILFYFIDIINAVAIYLIT